MSEPATTSATDRDSTRTRRIVVVGGGFTAVEAVRRLMGRLPAGWEVVVYSEENHFVFTPLLTEVVGANINPLHVVWPLREMARGASCRTAPVVGLDLEGRQVIVEERDGELQRASYDHLVLALGQAPSLDMIPGLASHGWPLKNLGDALALRNRLIGQLERAEVEDDPELCRRLLSVAVVGAGFTGIEVAGSIADLMKEASRFYERVQPGDLRVTVVEALDRMLPSLPESLADFAHRKMEQRGIDIRLGVPVEAVTAQGLQLGEGELLEAGTVVAAVGTTVQPLLADAGLPLENKRLVVTPEMRVEGHDRVWAAGDCAAVPNAREEGEISPPTAQFATRQGRQLADNLLAVIGGDEPRPFDYRPQGMFAVIGHRNAVGQAWGIRFSGFLAWFLWHGVYWSKMPTWTRKIQIGLDWAVNYLFRPDIVELATLTTRRQGRVREEEILRFAGEAPELASLPVADLMSRPLVSLGSNFTLRQAVRLCRRQRTHALPVLDERERLVGICTRSDLYRAVRALRDLETPVSDVMSRPVITLEETASLADALRLAREHDVKRLVVVARQDDRQAVGMLTPFDVLDWLTGGRDDEAAPVEQWS